MAHRGDDREPITGIRHVQVSDKHIEAFCSDKFQGFRHTGGRDYVKSLVLKCRAQHVTDGIIVIH